MYTKLTISLFWLLTHASSLASHSYHAVAAKLAERPGVSAELLLGMAYVESRYMPEAVSRMENGVRRTGIPRWKNPPEGTTGPYFCGVTQAEAGYSWEKCLRLRNIFVAYKTTAAELRKWLAYCHEDIECALAGYGGGIQAAKMRTSTYPARVLERATRFGKAAS